MSRLPDPNRPKIDRLLKAGKLTKLEIATIVGVDVRTVRRRSTDLGLDEDKRGPKARPAPGHVCACDCGRIWVAP